MSRRYQTISFVTGSVSSGANVDTNSTGNANFMNIVSVSVVPSAVSAFTAKIFKKDTYSDSDLLASWENVQGSLYYPTDVNTGGQAEEGFPIPYDDEDETGELHFRITNLDTVAHTYTVTILCEVSGPQPLLRVLTADATGVDSAAVQPWFPSTGAVTVESGTIYEFEGFLRTSRSAGTTSHTTAIIFTTGTCTFHSFTWKANINTGDTDGPSNQVSQQVATATVVKIASTSATEQTSIHIHGILRVNAGGTFIPAFQYSAAPGGAPSILTGSYFKLRKLGSSNLTAIGPWA